MKVGILTFHNAHNYGAVLQAYALKRTLDKSGHTAEIINYRNSVIDKKYQKQLKAGMELKTFLHPRLCLQKMKFMINKKIMRQAWEQQYERFEEFIGLYLTDMPQMEIEELEHLDYDILIAGSDQIWAGSLTGGIDKVYLLDFPFEGRRVSYAASLSGGSVPNEDEDIMRRCLKNFDFISAREKTLADSLSQICGKKVVTTLDPTLLLESSDYQFLLKKDPRTEEKYIFAYYVSEDDVLRACALEMAERLGIQLFELHYYMKKDYDKHSQFADFGPSEFISFLAGADFVLTNSFHGTIFAILFQRRFYSVYRENARIENLLNRLELTNCHIYSMQELDDNLQIDYQRVMDELQIYRKESIGFLNLALGELHNGTSSDKKNVGKQTVDH